MSDDLYDIFPERLQAVMTARHMRQVDFSGTACSDRTVFKYLRCRHLPGSYMLRELCEMLNVSADYLLGLSDDMSERPSWKWIDGECVCSSCGNRGETTFVFCPTCGERMHHNV